MCVCECGGRKRKNLELLRSVSSRIIRGRPKRAVGSLVLLLLLLLSISKSKRVIIVAIGCLPIAKSKGIVAGFGLLRSDMKKFASITVLTAKSKNKNSSVVSIGN